MLASPKYNYKAKAVALAGTFSRPLVHDLGEMVKTELSDGAGGYHSQRLGAFRYQEILSFDAAYTQVTASEGPAGHFNTMAIATIENLNVLDIVKVERITARLIGLHHEDDFDACPAWIIPLGSEIVNLRVAGKTIDVQHPPGWHLDLEKPVSYQEWRAKPDHNRWLHGGTTIEVPRFGKVTYCVHQAAKEQYKGSRKAQPMLHTVSMLKFKLGSPIEADFSAGGVETDGNPP